MSEISREKSLKILKQWAECIEPKIPAMKFIEVGQRNNTNFGMSFFYTCSHKNSRCLFVEIEQDDLRAYYNLKSQEEKK